MCTSTSTTTLGSIFISYVSQASHRISYIVKQRTTSHNSNRCETKSRTIILTEIPFQMVKLNNLEIFNVSYNNLSGVVPNTGQFGTFVEDSYLGNPFLYVESLCRTPNAYM